MTDEWQDPYTCPVCNQDTVPAYGDTTSPILVIGEMPGKEELEKSIPFVGPSGNVLRSELAYLGVELRDLRRCNLWLHPPNKNEDCLKYGAEQVIKEAKGRLAILLLGSDTVKYFTNKSVSSVSGLKLTSPYLSAPLIMACPNPANVFHSRCGEVRLSLQKFIRTCREEGII